ncbi:MAG: hypothetical protein QOK39_62 [Acidimicrobiaceae bacterium]|nr:hypothetical protein [Acidimicrobiaceae bacterium]
MSTWVSDQTAVSQRRRAASGCGHGTEARRRADTLGADPVATIAADLERIAATVEYLYGGVAACDLAVNDALHSLHRAIGAIREADGAAPTPSKAEHWIG